VILDWRGPHQSDTQRDTQHLGMMAKRLESESCRSRLLWKDRKDIYTLISAMEFVVELVGKGKHHLQLISHWKGVIFGIFQSICDAEGSFFG
jgi:hypothetical protein